MSPEAAQILLDDIVPILAVTIKRTVTPIGSEDHQELIQDAIGDAAKAVDAMERTGRAIMARSIAYYSVQRSKIGRRMMDCGTSDAFSTMRRVKGDCLLSYDEPIDAHDTDGLCVGDCIADHRPDPSEEAARRIDWETMLNHLDNRQRRVVEEMAVGTMSVDIAKLFGISPARVTQIKLEIAAVIKEALGEDILAELNRESPWRRDVRCLHERREARFDVDAG